MISEIEAREILDGKDLIAIGVRGDDIRRRLHGARTTFVRVLEVHVDAVPPALPSGTAAGEIRIVGVPASLDVAVAAVRSARSLAAGLPLTGFSLPDISGLAGAASCAAACRALRDAGLEAIAEVPLDLLSDAAALVADARGAGLSVPRLTVHALAESDRLSLVNRARELQAAVGGFLAFAPLPRAVAAATPTTGYDDVKQIALARIVADNIPSIQVDWKLYGPKLAQVALTTGADDIDGVAAIDPGTLGPRRSPIEEIRGNIRAAALEPVERNGRFEAIG